MPTNTPNKVKYGLKNAHYARLTIGEDGTVTYGKPIAIPGSVTLTMDAQGDTSTFYADNMAYFVTAANDGYSGTFEVALIPDQFRQDVLHETMDEAAQVLVENINNQTSPFALLFEFDGDQRAIRRCLYNCTCTRPSIESETTEETVEPGTETLSITNSPRSDGLVKAQTGPDTDAETYAGWYSNVYTPVTSAEEASLTADQGTSQAAGSATQNDNQSTGQEAGAAGTN